MRITCPSCNAHYEIGDDLIGPEGREVQCSNCGTTWFQEREDRAAAAPDIWEDEEDEEDGGDDAPSSSPPPRRPAADKAALDILREERAREDRLRAGSKADAEADGPRDAAPEEPPRAPSAREAAAAERVRMAAAATHARTRDAGRAAPPVEAPPTRGYPKADAEGSDATEGPGAWAAPSLEVYDEQEDSAPALGQHAPAAASERRGRITRLGLLPDIEEINSSLRPDDRGGAGGADAAAEDNPPDAAAKAGFRRGFLAICAIAAALVAIYAFEGPIGRNVPALAPPVTGYVAWIDARRAELEEAVEALTAQISPDP